MSPFKNEAEEGADDIQDAIHADPKTDYEPPEGQSQEGPGDGADQQGSGG
jgi:hypothetical protein